MPNPPADLPKFKRLHKALWNQMLAQKHINQLVGQTIAGRATAHERECLERVRSESKLALNHINEAIQRLFETTESPSELAKHGVRRVAPGDRHSAGLFSKDRDDGK